MTDNTQFIVLGAPLSPFVRKLRLCLAEKGLAYQLEMVMPGDRSPGFRAISPLGRIPALRHGDLSLADSSVICHYLEDIHPQPALYGADARQAAQVRWLEKYADYELAPLATFTVFRNRVLAPLLGKACDQEAVDKALEQDLPPHFDYLQEQLGEREFFVGDALSIADLAIASQLVSLEHAGESLDASRWPRLGAFYQRLKARPTLQAILPGEQAMLAKLRQRAG